MKKLYLNVEEFQEYLKNRKIVCFGAGKHGRRMLDILHNYHKLNDLIGFIDNASEKWDTCIQYADKSYSIMSLQQAKNILDEDVVIIITCLDYISVLNQLETEPALTNCTCVSLVEVGQKQLLSSDYAEVVKQYDSPVIPKKIHYCWFGGKEKSDLLKRNIEQWHHICPDYEIIEGNESNYDVTKNAYMRQAYDKERWGFVPDYARLDIIYEHGGIYLDTDVEIIKKPDELLYQDCFAAGEGSLLMALGAGFGARPKCEIIRELRDYYDDVSFIRENGSVDDTACMMHSYAVLKKHGYKVNDKLQIVNGMAIYPMIFQGTCSYLCQKRITDKTYFCHYGSNTWLDEKYHVIKRKIAESSYSEGQGELISYMI